MLDTAIHTFNQICMYISNKTWAIFQGMGVWGGEVWVGWGGFGWGGVGCVCVWGGGGVGCVRGGCSRAHAWVCKHTLVGSLYSNLQIVLNFSSKF